MQKLESEKKEPFLKEKYIRIEFDIRAARKPAIAWLKFEKFSDIALDVGDLIDKRR